MNSISNPNWLSFVGSIYAAIGIVIFALGTRASLLPRVTDVTGKLRSTNSGLGVMFGAVTAASGLLLQGFGQVYAMPLGASVALLVLIAGILPVIYTMISDQIEMSDLNRRPAGDGKSSAAPAEAARRLEVVHEAAGRAAS